MTNLLPIKPLFGAVIVSFHPKLQAIEQLIHQLQRQLILTDVVENHSLSQSDCQRIAAITTLILLKDNFVIVYAQNIGVRYLLIENCQWLFF